MNKSPLCLAAAFLSFFSLFPATAVSSHFSEVKLVGADPASPLFDNNNVELDFETWEIIPPNPDEIALARVAILPHDIPFQELNQLFLDSYNSQLAMPRFEVPESEAGLLLLLKGSDMNVIYAERLHHHHHHQSSGGSSSNLYFRDVGIAANPWLASTGNWRKRSYQIWLPIVHRLKAVAHIPLAIHLNLFNLTSTDNSLTPNTNQRQLMQHYSSQLSAFQRLMESAEGLDLWRVESDQVWCTDSSSSSSSSTSPTSSPSSSSWCFEESFHHAKQVVDASHSYVQLYLERNKTISNSTHFKQTFFTPSITPSLHSLISLSSDILKARLDACLKDVDMLVRRIRSPLEDRNGSRARNTSSSPLPSNNWTWRSHVVIGAGHMDETDHWALEHFQNLLSGTSSTSHCFASGCHPSSNHVNGSTSTASSSKDQGKVYSTHHASIPNDIELIKFLERHKVDEVLGELVFDDAGRMHSDVLSRKRRSKEDHEGGRKKRRSLEAFLDQERGDGGGSRCPFSR